MNDYFVNITKNLDIPDLMTEELPDNIVLETLDPIDHIIYKYGNHPSIVKLNEFIDHDNNFSFNKISQTEIREEIIKLNSKKAAGVDTIPPKVIKDAIHVVTSPLTQLFNLSVEGNHFPSDLTYANVAPLFKKDDNTNKENYRPISILPSISKIFERLMFQQITSYISNILSPYLCGFRKGYNTQHVLLRLKYSLNKSIDKRKKVGLFMIDLSKAFDCISHELLIAKLHAYGFESDCLKLIFSYLHGRKQRVKINSEHSTWKDILSGVPQGSVLGPLFFNIFINDLFMFVEHSDVFNYADDNSLSVTDINIENIITKLEYDINIIDKWLKENGLLLNEDKCKFMVIESSRSQHDAANVCVQNKNIAEVESAKLLGITIDNHITMDKHIVNICKQAGNKLSALARICHFLNEQMRKILMKSFIISQFNYCPIVWMYCQRKSNNLINRIHERALRIPYNDYISDFDTLLSNDDSVTVHQRNIQYLTLEIHKTINNLNPEFMKDIFCLKQQHYSARSQTRVHPKPKTVIYGVEPFGYKANQIWKSLPKDMQETKEMATFKKYSSQLNDDICNCNLCKLYIPNLGYIQNSHLK